MERRRLGMLGKDLAPRTEAASNGSSIDCEGSKDNRSAQQNASADPYEKYRGGLPEVEGRLYQKPPTELINYSEYKPARPKRNNESAIIEAVLRNHGISIRVVDIIRGPVFTRYEAVLGKGVSIASVRRRRNEIALALEAVAIDSIAHVPGKAVIGIDAQNKTLELVTLRDVLFTEEMRKYSSILVFPIGKGMNGNIIINDMFRTHHLMIIGTIGSGKSSCLNTLLITLAYRATPSEINIVIIDKKSGLLTRYNGMPHLVDPVVTDTRSAISALRWVKIEIEERNNRFGKCYTSDITIYNKNRNGTSDYIPHLFLIIEDLFSMFEDTTVDVDELLEYIIISGRTTGVHLVASIEMPIRKRLYRFITNNVSARIVLSTPSGKGSQALIGLSSDEKLLGDGDMLYITSEIKTPIRLKGCYVSEAEIDRVTTYLRIEGMRVAKSVSHGKHPLDSINGMWDVWFNT
jgi:S-DNA-T family DNA segregation ATPase FtsK/SpoIIIE